jgi:hypothetical protein
MDSDISVIPAQIARSGLAMLAPRAAQNDASVRRGPERRTGVLCVEDHVHVCADAPIGAPESDVAPRIRCAVMARH